MTEKEFQKQVELEMAYEPYSSLTGCLKPCITETGDLRECRRGKNHTGLCASGYGDEFRTWEKTSQEPESEMYNQSFESYN